jgi:imidazolonepropionase-like amidohydrolase
MSRFGMALCATVLAGGMMGYSADIADQAAPPGLALRVAKVVAMDDANTVVNDAVVLVKGNRIEAVGPAGQIAIPEGYRVLRFAEHWLVPGIVEAHNHASAGGWGDLNDMVYQTNPGLDTRSIPWPDNPWVKRARTGGVTTTMLLPGSGTNLSGFGTIVNTGGNTPDEITVRTPGSLKVAQAGNPEWYFGGNGRSFMNWNLRQTIEKARAYWQEWHAYEAAAGLRPGRDHDPAPPKPDFDPIWDGFRGVFDGSIPVTVHTQIYQVLLMTVNMFGSQFGLWTITDHSSFDAWKVGPVVRAFQQDPRPHAPLWVVQGPRQYHFDRTARRMIGNADGWWKNGIHDLGINTDSPVVPQEELTYQSAMACWYGWLPYPGLRAITSVSAKALGLYDRVGSVEAGKQADLSIWTGDPLDPRSACLMTILNGQIVYDGTQGMRRF